MGVLKSCLAVVGLTALLLIGSCVFGLSALGTLMDPHDARATVARPPDEVKQDVYAYLQGATNGSFRAQSHVDYMSDGSMRLLVGKSEPYQMTMTVTFEPEDSGKATLVTATYNADRLAWGQADRVQSTRFDRRLRADFLKQLTDIGKGEGSGSLDLDALLAAARKNDLGSGSTR